METRQPQNAVFDDRAPKSDSDDGLALDQVFPARFRTECNEVLKRLFPEDGAESLGDWDAGDILKLTTICEVARVAREAEVKKPWLSKHTLIRVLNKLATGSFFKGHGNAGLVDLEYHLRLLAGVLRLYQYENVSLDHALRLKLCKGIQQLDDAFQADRRKCLSENQIENQNVALLVNHCQYLLFSIKDADSLGTAISKRAMLGVDGALSGYGGQWVEARRALREITRFERPIPKWHKEFVRLEDMCFALMARDYKVQGSQLAAANESETAKQQTKIEERGTALELCDALEKMLQVEGDVGKFYSALETLRKGFGKATQLLFDSGVYEENAEYFQYGIMDLMQRISYHIDDRTYCFKEFIRVIKTTLEKSHAKANFLHRKAIDLYRRINSLGETDRLRYGKEEDCKAIESWLAAHRSEVESAKASSRYDFLNVLLTSRRVRKHTADVEGMTKIGNELLKIG
jgi:hypothetical protein